MYMYKMNTIITSVCKPFFYVSAVSTRQLGDMELFLAGLKLRHLEPLFQVNVHCITMYFVNCPIIFPLNVSFLNNNYFVCLKCLYM